MGCIDSHKKPLRLCFRRICLVLFLLALASTISPAVLAADCESSLVLHMVNSYGQKTKAARVEVRTVSGALVKSALGSTITFTGLPCGDYLVKAWAPLGSINTVYAAIHVGISQRELFLGLPVRFGDWEGEYGIRSITGHIVADGGLQPDLWIRLESLYLPIRLDAKPDKKGHFRFDGLEGGYYSVLIYRGNSLILTREVEIDLVGPEETALELRLPRED